MGQQTSSSIESGNLTHQRLGLIRAFQQSDFLNQYQNSYRIQLKKDIQSQRKFDKWITDLRQMDTQQARDILYFPLSFKYQQTGLCGSSGHVILTFENFPYVLKGEIKNRRRMIQYFQETQLWYLLYNLVQAGFIFQKKNKKLGDIHPNNCLLNENGLFKIICNCSLPDQTTNYSKIIESPTNDAFLAPEEIDSTLLQKGIYPNVDFKKAEVYCMGMTLLEVATLQDCFYTYNRGPYKINKRRLADLLKIVKQKYSTKFYDYLSNMLEEQPSRRKNFSTYFVQLSPFQEAIIELKPFSFQLQSSSLGMAGTNNILENTVSNQSTIRGQRFNYNISSSQDVMATNKGGMNYPIAGSNQSINYTHTQPKTQSYYKKH